MIYSAKVISLARRGAEFGLKIGSLNLDMAGVQQRKRLMVEGLHQMHVDLTAASGAELIMGEARFVGPLHNSYFVLLDSSLRQPMLRMTRRNIADVILNPSARRDLKGRLRAAR